VKRKSILFMAIALSFGFGFEVKSLISAKNFQQIKTGRVTGVGGIFFKCKDPKALREWYKNHLGLATDKYGTNFVWFQGADSTKKGYK